MKNHSYYTDNITTTLEGLANKYRKPVHVTQGIIQITLNYLRLELNFTTYVQGILTVTGFTFANFSLHSSEIPDTLN